MLQARCLMLNGILVRVISYMFILISERDLELSKRDLKKTKRAAVADGTNKNLKLQWKSFVLFCIHFNQTPIPCNSETIALYAQFLSRSFKVTDSVKNYISGVRTMHILLDKDFPDHSLDVLKIRFYQPDDNISITKFPDYFYYQAKSSKSERAQVMYTENESKMHLV